jgi:hypothetical protein
MGCCSNYKKLGNYWLNLDFVDAIKEPCFDDDFGEWPVIFVIGSQKIPIVFDSMKEAKKEYDKFVKENFKE